MSIELPEAVRDYIKRQRAIKHTEKDLYSVLECLVECHAHGVKIEETSGQFTSRYYTEMYHLGGSYFTFGFQDGEVIDYQEYCMWKYEGVED